MCGIILVYFAVFIDNKFRGGHLPSLCATKMCSYFTVMIIKFYYMLLLFCQISCAKIQKINIYSAASFCIQSWPHFISQLWQVWEKPAPTMHAVWGWQHSRTKTFQIRGIVKEEEPSILQRGGWGGGEMNNLWLWNHWYYSSSSWALLNGSARLYNKVHKGKRYFCVSLTQLQVSLSLQ